MENWQSEYLQFTLFILATVWLLQKGSPESKELGKAGPSRTRTSCSAHPLERKSPLWARAGGIRSAIYSNSLLIVMGIFFIGSWFAHSVTGWSEFNAEQLEHARRRAQLVGYIGDLDVLGADASELAVGVPGDRLDGRPLHIPAPARVTRIEAGRRAARRDGRRQGEPSLAGSLTSDG